MDALDGLQLDGQTRDVMGRLPRTLVEFRMEPRRDTAASEKEGRPMYRDVEYISISSPGNRDVTDKAVTDEHRRVYGDAYRAWRAGLIHQPTTGTALLAWPAASRSQVEELRHVDVRTVEQLADMSDATAATYSVGPLKQAARDWLAAARDGGSLSAIRAELDRTKAEVEVLRRANKDLGEQLDAARRAKK